MSSDSAPSGSRGTLTAGRLLQAAVGIFAFGVALTLWIVQQGMPTIAEQEAAGERLEKLFHQYEKGRLPVSNKDQVVGRIRSILVELGLLEATDEEDSPAQEDGPNEAAPADE